MRRLSVLGVVFSIAVGIGCGPGKELPDAPVRHKDVPGSADDPNGTPPAASQPAAKEVLDRAIKAITENDPGKLARTKVAKVTYQGSIRTAPQASELTKAVLTIETVWPDLAFVTDDLKAESLTTTLAFVLHHPHGWLKIGPRLDQTPPLEVGRAIRNDLSAWHWMMLGLPLNDPKLVAFDLSKRPGGVAVKLALPERPVYLVTFDEMSGLPVRSEYYPLEHSKRVRKVFRMSEHKSTGGLLLPTKIELTQDEVLVEQWAQPTWEFPESIDPSRFEQPKQ